MFAVSSLLALVLTAAPVSPAPAHPDSVPTKTCLTPERTGSFRVTATKPDGSYGVLAVVLLEDINGCLEATFITDDKGPAAIDRLTQSPNLLKGRLNVTGEAAEVTLRFEGQRVAGSIVGRKQEWRIEGRKTS